MRRFFAAGQIFAALSSRIHRSFRRARVINWLIVSKSDIFSLNNTAHTCQRSGATMSLLRQPAASSFSCSTRVSSRPTSSPAHEQQRRRQPSDRRTAASTAGPPDGRYSTPRKTAAAPASWRGVNVAVVDIRLAGAGQIGPRRDADQPAWRRQLPLLEPQAQAVDQPAARRLAAQQDLVGRIPLRADTDS